MKKKLIFLLLALLALAPWPVAYAYGSDTAGQAPIPAEAAPPEAAPKWNAFGGAIGGITPGDLFYIDTSHTTADMAVTLYLTNTDELIHCYRYLTLRVSIYVETGAGRWEKTTIASGESPNDTYLTLLNGSVSFTLPGSLRKPGSSIIVLSRYTTAISPLRDCSNGTDITATAVIAEIKTMSSAVIIFGFCGGMIE